MCGSKRKSDADLLKHYKQLHERERVKLNNLVASKRNKQKAKFRERHRQRIEKFAAAYRQLVHPTMGYSIIRELRGLGVEAETVKSTMNAADDVLVSRLQRTKGKGGVDVVIVVSDDKEFLRRVRTQAGRLARVLVISEKIDGHKSRLKRSSEDSTERSSDDRLLWSSLLEPGLDTKESLAQGALEELQEHGDNEPSATGWQVEEATANDGDDDDEYDTDNGTR